MAKAKSDLTWTEINVDSLNSDTRRAYDNYKTAYRAMKEARELFELEMQVFAPQGQRIVCGYNFGKLSIAMTTEQPKAPTKAKQSLADFIAAQQASGRRA